MSYLCTLKMYFVLLRFKKEELKIEAWESRQRTKVEFEMRRLEVHFHKIFLSFQWVIVLYVAITEKSFYGRNARRKWEAKRWRGWPKSSRWRAVWPKRNEHQPTPRWTSKQQGQFRRPIRFARRDGSLGRVSYAAAASVNLSVCLTTTTTRLLHMVVRNQISSSLCIVGVPWCF